MNKKTLAILSILFCLMFFGAAIMIFKTEALYLYYSNTITTYIDPSDSQIRNTCLDNKMLSSQQKLDCVGDFAHDASLADPWRGRGICNTYAPLSGIEGSTAKEKCYKESKQPTDCGLVICFKGS